MYLGRYATSNSLGTESMGIPELFFDPSPLVDRPELQSLTYYMQKSYLKK